MNITLQINHKVEWGQQICIIGSCGTNTRWTEENPLLLTCQGAKKWITTIQISNLGNLLSYKYAIKNEDDSLIYEDGAFREIALNNNALFLQDFWRTFSYENIFNSSAFSKSLFVRKNAKANIQKQGNITFCLTMPQIEPTQGLAVVGNIPELGNWDIQQKVVLSDAEFPIWKTTLEIKNPHHTIEYKYIVYELKKHEIVDYEGGENRRIDTYPTKSRLICSDIEFRRTKPRWKGAGVAIPVFSIRTKDSFGIGEFLDLKKVADWAASTGQTMIQTLPINDTTLYHTNRDSYPYNAVSVFALNPIYLNIACMGKFKSTEQEKEVSETKALFNAKSFVDYQVVATAKMKYFKLLYKQEKDSTFSSNEYKEFFKQNQDWLVPYATFCFLRDKFGTPNFKSWKEHSIYCAKEIEALTNPQNSNYNEIALHYYLQFHLHKQLTEAKNYAHKLGIALKGDIPIGISPDSVEAWTNPELFNLDTQAGAPPDDFSISGQNWGFPTYNWDVMEQDGFLWWKKRFCKMADYFDAYRIDHILGFFRIWEMSKDDVWGLTGRFSPALPYTPQELWDMGIKLNEERMLKPYIRESLLNDIFGKDTIYIKEKFLFTNDNNIYNFKPEFDTQKKIETFFANNGLTNEHDKVILRGLFRLHCEVLFVRDLHNPHLLHPRIALQKSYSFKELDNNTKEKLEILHENFFYHRHNEFWKHSALYKLPKLIAATNMLVCGEDLGMVPATVADVMNKLHILSLEIQRMPKDSNLEFFHPANAPYLSVCTTGTHDMNPLRAWWEEDKEATQRFYNQLMGYWGQAPEKCSAEIATFIINQHIYSPAMWVILPLQDWLAIDEDIRLKNTQAERINIPDNPQHFWCYRMHLTMEDLIANKPFNNKVKKLLSPRL